MPQSLITWGPKDGDGDHLAGQKQGRGACSRLDIRVQPRVVQELLDHLCVAQVTGCVEWGHTVIVLQVDGVAYLAC